MLTDAQLDKYADVLLWGLKTARKEKFKKKDIVLVQYDPLAVQLVEVLQAKLLAIGMNPVTRVTLTPVMEHNFYGKADDGQLTFLDPGRPGAL